MRIASLRRLFNPGLWLLLIGLGVAMTGPLVAQSPPAEPPPVPSETVASETVPSETVPESASPVEPSPPVPAPEESFFTLSGEPPEGAWIELMPLGLVGEPGLLSLTAQNPDSAAQPLALPAELPSGATMVCSGAPSVAVGCQRVFLHRQADRRGEVADDLEITVDFAPGLEIVGLYVMDALPVEGARVTLVPAGLEASRAFSVPLQPEEAGADGRRAMVREVLTDAEGRFRLPQVREGHYRLETLLPTGRVHRPDPFELPAPQDVEIGPLGDEQRILWDLGQFDVTDWLAVEVVAVDEHGEPIVGVEVTARQGSSLRSLLSFRGRTDADGLLRLSGFDPERPLRLDCVAAGHGAWGADFELLPVEVVCRLDRLARVMGRLLDVGGEPLTGGAVSMRLSDEQADDRVAGQADAGRMTAVPGEDGDFSLQVPSGRYALTVAAPGRQSDERVVYLDAGEELDLGEIALAPGRELKGLVIEAPAPPDGPPPLNLQDEGEPVPVPFAEVRAIEPPGAAQASVDGDGAFVISSIGDASLELEVTAEGFAAERLVLEPAEQRRDSPLLIELHRGGWIRALVSQGGEPCAGCVVRLLPHGPDLLTDAEGEALSPPLRPGLYRLEKPQVLHLGSQVVEIPSALIRRTRVVADEVSTVRFELEPERVAVRFEPRPDSSHDWWLIARSAVGEERLEPDEEGLFHVPRPGQLPQHLFLTRFDPVSGHDVEVRVATLAPSVRLPADEPLVLPLPSGAIHGRLRGQKLGEVGLRELAGVRVRLQTIADGAHVAELRSDAEGRFHLEHIPPGVYSVVFGERSFQFISLSDGTRLDLGDFQLVDGAF